MFSSSPPTSFLLQLLLTPPSSPLHRFASIQACEQQLLQFRGLSGSLCRWLQDQLPSAEANLNTESLQRRVQQLQVRRDAAFRERAV